MLGLRAVPFDWDLLTRATFLFFFFQLKYIWHVIMYKFKVHNMVG